MDFDTPENLRYTETHEWIDPETGRVGITDFAQDELGDVVFVELPAEGTDLTAGEAFGVVESIKAVSDVYAPVDGGVTAVNADLGSAPELLNEDPFGEGWMLELDSDAGDPEGLLTAAEYRERTE
jgi:glycine cleavage system H protein